MSEQEGENREPTPAEATFAWLLDTIAGKQRRPPAVEADAANLIDSLGAMTPPPMRRAPAADAGNSSVRKAN